MARLFTVPALLLVLLVALGLNCCVSYAAPSQAVSLTLRERLRTRQVLPLLATPEPEVSEAQERVSAAAVPVVCQGPYGDSSASLNFNDSTAFGGQTLFPSTINIFAGDARYPTKTSGSYTPIDRIATTYSYGGGSRVTVSDGSSNIDYDYQWTYTLANGDYVTGIIVNEDTTGPLKGVYGLKFYSYCGCNISAGFFGGPVTTNNITEPLPYVLEYFKGTVGYDAYNKAYIRSLYFCFVKLLANPVCPPKPCTSSLTEPRSTADSGQQQELTPPEAESEPDQQEEVPPQTYDRSTSKSATRNRS